MPPSVATLRRWQPCRGLGSRFPVDWVAGLPWIEWQPSHGLGGRNPWNTHSCASERYRQIECTLFSMTTAVYIRVSSHSQKTASQKADIRRWLNAHGHDLDSVQWFEDTETG